MTRVLVFLTAFLSVGLSCLFVAASAQWDNWRALAQNFQIERDAAITQRLNVEAASQAQLSLKDDSLKDRERALAEAQRRMQTLTDENARMQSELARARNEAISAEAGRTKLQEILDVTTGEWKSAQSQNQTLLTQNIDLQTRNTRLNSRVLELTANVTILTDQVRNIQEKLFACEQGQPGGAALTSAGRAGAGESATGAVPVSPTVKGPIHGQITSIEGDYASIDIGESSGVVAGMTFMVYRGAQYLGDLEVKSVRPKEAGGKLTTVQGDIRSGDRVSYQL